MAEKIGNRYIIVKPIGEGGMANVYLAVDTILKREVAIKVLRGELNQDPVNLARFQKEAMAISNTSHPNIVDIYDVGEDNGKNYIVMEFVRGKTLKQLIKSRGVIGTDEAVNIMKQLVSATANAHKMGIIHRDIKSQNVLVKDDGTVKLSDFGIAYTDDQAGLTQTKTVMGSVHYLAPELSKGEMCTPQSDIYSLGIVFYELLTGDVPFHGDTAVEIALKHIHNDIPHVRDFNPDIPQSVENIVIKSTAKKPSQRYSSAIEMFNDLVTCLDLSRNNEQRLNIEKATPIEKKVEKVETEKKKVVKRKKKTAKKIDPMQVIIAVAAVALSVLILLMISTLASKGNRELVYVPSVEKMTLQQAREAIDNAGLIIETIGYQATDDLDKDIVISISPNQGNQVSKGSYVSLVVSLGKKFTLENYVGKNIDEVKAQLEAAGITVNVRQVEKADTEVGTILRQDYPEGTVVEPTDRLTITLEVSTYVTFMIPNDIIGKNVDEARAQLIALGATVKVEQKNIEENIDENGEYIYPEYTVVSCSPDVNTYYTQSPGLVITLYYY